MAPTPQGNGGSGVLIKAGAENNLVGNDGRSDPVSSRNVISGNKQAGVHIQDDDTDDNLVAGNYIGTDSTGANAVPNTTNGVVISSGASNNTVGNDGKSTPDASRNVISGNTQAGVRVSGLGSNGNRIAGNYIGTDATGAAAVANVGGGVQLDDQIQNIVVGTDGQAQNDAAERNVISGNTGAGIDIDGINGALVAGNYIGTTADGQGKLGNTGDGVLIEDGATQDIIGDDGNGPGDDKRNVISGNGGDGVKITGTNTGQALVADNFIGLGADGLAAIGNAGDGVAVANTGSNIIGGKALGSGNVISANGGDGVSLVGGHRNDEPGRAELHRHGREGGRHPGQHPVGRPDRRRGDEQLDRRAGRGARQQSDLGQRRRRRDDSGRLAREPGPEQ